MDVRRERYVRIRKKPEKDFRNAGLQKNSRDMALKNPYFTIGEDYEHI